MRFRRTLLVLLRVLALLVVSPAAWAEPVEGWLETGLRLKPAKRLRLDGSVHLRLDEDLSRIQRVMPEAGARYRAAKWLRFGGGYRFSWERDKRGDFEPGHRVHAEAAVELPMGKLELRYRLRGQHAWEWTRWGERKDENVLRNQLRLAYGWRDDVRSTAWAEHFLNLDELQDQPTRKWRFGLGTEVEAGKLEVEPFAMMEVEDDEGETLRTFIFGASIWWAL